MNSFGHGGRTPRPKPLPEARGEKRPPGALSPSARKPAIMQDPVLVLNATFEPINVTAVRRAMVLMIKGVAQAEEIHHTQVHSASRALPVPSVIRLLAYRHIPQQVWLQRGQRVDLGLSHAHLPEPFGCSFLFRLQRC